jgi:selenocysteine lyase/cysteine desulfurase
LSHVGPLPGARAEPGRPVSLTDPTSLRAIRAEIPGLDQAVYLNTGTLGPSPRGVTRRLFQLYETWQEAGPGNPKIYIGMAQASLAAKTPIAAFLGAQPDELALTGNSTDGINIVARGIDWKPGDEVIISDEEHPAGLLIWLHLRQTKGLRIRIARLDHVRAAKIVEDVTALITPRTRLVALSHVSSMTGLCLPAREITEACHAHRVPVLFDGAQAAGQFPLRIADLGCDFYAVNGHKWLLGPIGVGALYVAKGALVELVPDRVGGGSALNYTYAEEGEISFHPSARRLEFGTRCHPLWQAWPESLAFLGRIGLQGIQARGLALSQALRRGLAGLRGVTLIGPTPDGPPELLTAAVTCRLRGFTGEGLQEVLLDRFGLVTRPVSEHEATRFTCAFFNTEEEVVQAVRAMRILATETAA